MINQNPELIIRDRCNFDVFRLKDDWVIDLDSLPEPKEIAAEIVAGLKSAARFEKVLSKLQEPRSKIIQIDGLSKDSASKA